jgi:hypothetical protein
VLEHTHTTPQRLYEAVRHHYQRRLSYELFKLVGTSDLLGNPIGLLSSVATGVFALFYEPASAVFRGARGLIYVDDVRVRVKIMGLIIITTA